MTLMCGFIKLKSDKTETLVMNSDKLHPNIKFPLGPLSVQVKSAVRNLGVLFD